MTPTLESVQAEFKQWRRNKPYLRARTPDELRDQVLTLLPHHSHSDLCKILGMSRSMLQGWEDHANSQPTAVAEPIEFVALALESPPTSRPAESLTLALTQANGDHWCLQGDPSVEQLRTFVATLSGADR